MGEKTKSQVFGRTELEGKKKEEGKRVKKKPKSHWFSQVFKMSFL